MSGCLKEAWNYMCYMNDERELMIENLDVSRREKK